MSSPPSDELTDLFSFTSTHQSSELLSSPIDFPFHLAPPELRALFREDFHIRRTSLSWAWKDDIGDYPEVGAPLCALEPVQLPTCVCGCVTQFCYTTRLFHHNSLKSLKWQHGQWSLCTISPRLIKCLFSVQLIEIKLSSQLGATFWGVALCSET